jgi:predicted nucleic acid-binding protein
MNFILDTNAYSDFVRGDASVAKFLNEADVVYLPVIVIGELKRGFYYGTKVKENIDSLEKFLAKPRTNVLDITDETAEHYGMLAAYLKTQGTPIPINDIWIAALCLQYDLPLLTSDGDFQNLPQITLL